MVIFHSYVSLPEGIRYTCSWICRVRVSMRNRSVVELFSWTRGHEHVWNPTILDIGKSQLWPTGCVGYFNWTTLTMHLAEAAISRFPIGLINFRLLIFNFRKMQSLLTSILLTPKKHWFSIGFLRFGGPHGVVECNANPGLINQGYPPQLNSRLAFINPGLTLLYLI